MTIFSSWGPLGGPPGALLGRLGGLVRRLEAILDRRGATLGRLDALLDCLGALFGVSWAVSELFGGSGGPGGAGMRPAAARNSTGLCALFRPRIIVLADWASAGRRAPGESGGAYRYQLIFRCRNHSCWHYTCNL